MSSIADLDAFLQIPPGMKAPALKRFCSIVMANGTPSEQDYQNLVAEYQNFMVKFQNLWQMYNQLVAGGNYAAAMQVGGMLMRLTPMKSGYETSINQYQLNQYITQ